MSQCIDCENYREKDDLAGFCSASDDEIVESERDVRDCLANAFKPKGKKLFDEPI